MSYDEQLKNLQKQIIQKKRLESKLKELYKQRQDLSTKVLELKKIKLEEQSDVNSLERRSLSAFFYGVIGKMDEKLNKEREEAYAARVKYDVAARELSSVEAYIQHIEEELAVLLGCEQQYEKILEQKAVAIKTIGFKESLEILKIEKNITYMESQIKEINDVIIIGKLVLDTIINIQSNLDSAESFGTWDLLGGGFLVDIAKHDHLDEAQEQIESLQVQLRRFKTELTDVTIQTEMQVNIDGFLYFADYFFDGLFADWQVLKKINQSQEQVENIKTKVESVINTLKSMSKSTCKELECDKAKLNDLIITTSI